jgi:NADH-quinone oxidoreductase subunit N
MFISDLKFFIPEIFLSFMIIVIAISCIIFDNLPLFKGYKLDFIRLHVYATLLLLILLFGMLLNIYSYDFLVWNALFYSTKAVVITKLILTIIFFTVFSVILTYYPNNLKGYEFIVLLLLVLLSLFLVLMSADFLPLFFSFEMLSLSFYILVAYKRDSIFSTEGGLRYFILGAFTSCLFAIGISLIYYVFGSTNFFVISLLGGLSFDNLINDTFLFYGLIFILIAFFFKLSVFPFHFWTPDVYQGSPIIFTKVLATASKIALLTVLIKLIGDVFSFYQPILSLYFLIGGVGSVLIGTLGSLFQFKLKRLLAYSTISNMGYIFIALSIGSFDAYVAAYFYMLVYVLLNLNLFDIIISFIKKSNRKVISDISELIYLNTVYPLMALIFTFALFSIAGIPPLAGFFSKFYLFVALVAQNQYIWVVFLVIMSIISAGYYLRLVNFIYFQGFQKFSLYVKPNYSISIIVSFIFVINLVFLIVSKPLLSFCKIVVESLIV